MDDLGVALFQETCCKWGTVLVPLMNSSMSLWAGPVDREWVRFPTGGFGNCDANWELDQALSLGIGIHELTSGTNWSHFRYFIEGTTLYIPIYIIYIYIYVCVYVLYNIHIKRPKFQGRPKLWLWYSTFLRPRGHQSANPSPWFVPSWGIAPASAADGGNYPILMGKFDNNTLKHPKPHGKPMSEWSIFRMIWWVPCFRKHPHELEEFARRSCWKFTTGWFLSHKLFIILFTFGCLHWQLWPAVLSTNAALVSTNFTYENVHQLGNYSYSWVFCIYIYIYHTYLIIYIYVHRKPAWLHNRDTSSSLKSVHPRCPRCLWALTFLCFAGLVTGWPQGN